MRSISVSLFIILLLWNVEAVIVNISNVIPRTDNDGDIISAGDGCISYHPDEQLYYLFGAHYQPCVEPNDDCYCGGVSMLTCAKEGFSAEGTCCGWRNTTIASWSSPDLVTWTKVGLNILPLATANPASPLSSNYGAIFEPCGVYNRKTGFWNLFFLRDTYNLALAVARSAAGPFSVVQWAVPVPGVEYATMVDFYFWQLLDGTLIMKHNGDYGESAVILSDDYMRITNTSALFGTELGYTEGGGIFIHNDTTYIMAGHGCCFCTLGSNGYLWKANEPNNTIGSYSLLGDFVPRNPDGSSVTHAQQFSVTPIYTDKGVIPMFIGIRYGSAPDYRKDHDYQYWYPLSFNESSGLLNNVTWIDTFTVNLVAPVPPPLPPAPPAPWFSCSFDNPGTCFEVPAGAPGSSPTITECESACIPVYTCSGFNLGQCIPLPPGAFNNSFSTCEEACAPAYACSTNIPGQCEEVPNGTPDSFSSIAECTAQCVLCDLSGLWIGQTPGYNITVNQNPINSTTAAIVISVHPPAWTNATGFTQIGNLTVTNGWCGNDWCTGKISSLEVGGPACAMITWSDGSWCKPSLEPINCPIKSLLEMPDK